MNNKTLSLACLMTLAVLAGGAAPWRSLPSCLNGKWTGITATDEVGNVVGPEDPGDWGCVDETTGSVPTTPSGVGPVPPPTALCLRPAYPNPVSFSTRLEFTLPAASQVELVVYGKKGRGRHGAFPVRTLVDSEMAAGSYTVIWDGNDDQGLRLPAGIYRVAIVVGANSLCGDIEIR